MKKKIIVTILALALIGGGVFGYNLYVSGKNKNANVTTTKVVKGDIENVVTATGIVSPKSYVDVGAQVSGQVMKLHIEVGDSVKAGDLLAEIDKTVLETKVESSKAELVYQMSQLKDREAKLTLAKLTFQRQTELLASDATSKEAYENAEAALLSAEANIDMIKAQIAQTESSLKETKANLEYTMIYAPMSGTISSISVKKGQTLNANQNTPTILQIADLSTVTIEADVSEADVTKLTKGMEVYFKTLGSTKVWRTKLLKVEPTPKVTNNVVLYKAIFDVDNTLGDLMNSMTTQVFFVVSSSINATLVPVTAISKRDSESKNARILLQSPNGTFAPTRVELGVSNRVQVEILSGLNENDTIAANFASVDAPPRADSQRTGTNVSRQQRSPIGMMR